ncbi:hypothetical protein SLE2022_147050 [Rubroshorea leprosula]
MTRRILRSVSRGGIMEMESLSIGLVGFLLLAPAFSPMCERFHFDADENWVVGVVPKLFDLETVALHELGHILGLGHSSNGDAIMFPNIGPGMIKGLSPDDIKGIRVLYNLNSCNTD